MNIDVIAYISRLLWLMVKKYSVHYRKKMKFSIKNFFSECNQICVFLWTWSHLQKKSFMESFIVCAVVATAYRFMDVISYLFSLRPEGKANKRQAMCNALWKLAWIMVKHFCKNLTLVVLFYWQVVFLLKN